MRTTLDIGLNDPLQLRIAASAPRERPAGHWLGRMLRGFRAGDARLVINHPLVKDAPASLRLTSPAFADGGAIPRRHAGSGVGDNLSPALSWTGVPAGTGALALVMQDPDAPLPRPVLHLLATSIAPGRKGVDEGALCPQVGNGLTLGRGLFGRIGYAGPRPVRGHGTHRYVFQLLALEHPLALPDTPSLRDLLAALTPQTVLAWGTLIGTYERV
ncbi:MAG: YbhB/YbcL family Raf kinase inhibitor-like protein [Azospirillaceae bacterium]|nr:YbhB/YbcL family Raf kinase inhibitor-like protein [Azospirillaceae bacterium]